MALKKLEQAYQEIVKTQPYNQEAETIKLVAELAKEQIKDENSYSATR